MPKSTAPLTPLMQGAILGAKQRGSVFVLVTTTHARTFQALRDRGLVNLDATLTETGLRLHANLKETQRRAERAKALKPEPAVDPLEPVLEPVEPAAATGDRYMSTGPGADVKARDAQVIPEVYPVTRQDNGTLMVENDLPQRVQGLALTEELTGEVFAPVSASADLEELGVTEGTPEAVSAVLGKHSGLAVASAVDAARPGARAQVQMRPVNGEILECLSRETMTAVGAEWGAWEGHRVRIGGMDDSVMQGRHLLIIREDFRQEPNWMRDTDRTVPTAAALTDGCLVMVNGWQYRVRLRENGALGPMLVRVR